MNEKWIENLKDKMSDFEIAPPEGLSFESIGKEMEARRKSPEPKPVVFSRRRWAAAAAAVAIVGGVGVTVLMQVATESELPPGVEALRPDAPGEPSAEIPLSKNSLARSVVDKMPQTNVRQRNAELTAETEIEVSADGNAVGRQSADVDTTALTPSTPASEDIGKKKARQLTREEMDDVSRSLEGRCGAGCVSAASGGKTLVAVGFSASASGLGDTSGSAGYRHNGSGHRWMMPSADSNDLGTRMGGLKLDGLDSDDRPAQDMFEHKLPLSFGVDVSWRFLCRFALQAGVDYTLLRSEIKYGGSNPFTKGEATQRLHYVGVPVAVRYIPVEFRNFSVYLSAGATIEKCVAADIASRAEYADSYTYCGVGDRPWQFSLNLGAGVQYDITRSFAVYLQPSAGWYPDDGSRLRTIYKEHPWTFNLDLGLRFNLSR